MVRQRCIPIIFTSVHLLTILAVLILLTGSAVPAFGRKVAPENEAARSTARRKTVHLYFSEQKLRFLSAENREILCADDDASLGRCIITALMQGSQSGLSDVFPKDTELRAFFVTEDGTAYVDFNEALSRNHSGGARSELLTVFAIVNSLTLNLSSVDRVKFLIDGHQRETLAGHIGISDHFKANILLIR